MNARIRVSLCTIALSSLALGSCGATVTDFVDGSPVGIWQLTLPGDEEATVQLVAGGTLDLVEAEFGIERCIASSGTWSAEGGVLFITITTRNGVSVSETENIPFDVTSNTLTLNHLDDDPETFTRVDEMVDCPSYGWPTVTFRAVVDGVLLDFTDPFTPSWVGTGLSIGDLAALGFLDFGGRVGGGGGPALCPGCKELTIELQAGSLVPGSYDLDAGSGTGFFGRGNYWPDISAQNGHYTTDIGDPTEGVIVITSIGENHVRGTFEFTVFDGIGGGSIAVTDGVFDIVFN